MKQLILLYTLIAINAVPAAKAQHIVDGSFEDYQIFAGGGAIDSVYFKKLKLINPGIGFIRRGAGFLYTINPSAPALSPFPWKSAPDGNTYIIFHPAYGKIALYFSSPLVPNTYYTLRWVGAIQYHSIIPPPDSFRIELGMQILNPTRLLHEAVPLDTFGYRTYAVTFKADSSYPYLFISQNADGVYSGRACIDNIRLDTCVTVLPKRTIGCVSFPFTLPAIMAGKQVYWNTGDTTPSVVVNHNGFYIAQIYDSLGCVWVDSIEVNNALINTPASLSNTQLCVGDSLTLQSKFTGTYLWNTTANTQQIVVHDSGYFWVRTTFALGCDRIDSFRVISQLPPVPVLPKDTSFCKGEAVVLNTFVTGYSGYLWSNGLTDSIIAVNQSGTYKVTYTNGICSGIDSTIAYQIDIPQVHTDTSLCSSASILLIAPAADSYSWNTGDTTASISIDSAQTYWVVKTSNGCSVTDTFSVHSIALPASSSSIQNLCFGSSILLRSSQAQTYQWSNGSRDSILEVDAQGLYTVLKNNAHCFGIDSFFIIHKPLPVISSLNDTVVCFEDVKQLLLDAGMFKSYLWQPTGETSRYIYSSKAQPYLLTVTDSNNCSASKQFDVMETCPDFMFVPNAFTPNGDGINDVFLPHTRSLQYYEMTIVNRWGQTIFTTKETTQGWDGSNAPADVYVVHITYQPKGKAAQSKSQNVTLLR